MCFLSKPKTSMLLMEFGVLKYNLLLAGFGNVIILSNEISLSVSTKTKFSKKVLAYWALSISGCIFNHVPPTLGNV